MATTQRNRLMYIATPLGEDYLLINRLAATEGLSRLFSFEVELLHEEENPGFEPTIVDAKQMLGQGVTVSINQRDGTHRSSAESSINFRKATATRVFRFITRRSCRTFGFSRKNIKAGFFSTKVCRIF